MAATVWMTDFTDKREYSKSTNKYMVRRVIFLIALISVIFTTTFVVHAYNQPTEEQLTPNQLSDQQLDRIIVEPGMTLWTIASDTKPEGISVKKYVAYLMKINDLKSPVLQTGDVLLAP